MLLLGVLLLNDQLVVRSLGHAFLCLSVWGWCCLVAHLTLQHDWVLRKGDCAAEI